MTEKIKLKVADPSQNISKYCRLYSKKRLKRLMMSVKLHDKYNLMRISELR